MHRKNFTFLLIALLAVIPAAACADKKERLVSRVMVTGEADSKAPPDTALIVVSVVTQNKRALEAQQQNARKSEAVIRAVKEAAGANPEVQTSDYSLQPQRDYYGSMPRIVGYEARNSVTVKTGALDNVGAVVDAATLAGANSIERVSFILRESNEARAQTLADASQQAMRKAQAMAQALGGRIVRVLEEREGGFTNQPTTIYEADGEARLRSSGLMNMETFASAKAAPRTPLEAGPLNVRSQVQLVVEIEAQP